MITLKSSDNTQQPEPLRSGTRLTRSPLNQAWPVPVKTLLKTMLNQGGVLMDIFCCWDKRCKYELDNSSPEQRQAD
eukprot:11978814-Alexandrium_andersonii.AAC.1